MLASSFPTAVGIYVQRGICSHYEGLKDVLLVRDLTDIRLQ